MSARTTMMESSSNTLVYLHKNPRPIRTPVRGQCQENFGLFSTTHQNENMAATQKKSESGSIVMRKAPSNGLKKRTPNSFDPKIIVLARMAKATPGPLLK